MKVTHVTDSLRSGGKERQLLEVLKYFKKRPDFESELIIMSDDVHYDYLDDLNIKTYIVKRKSRKDPFIFIKFYKLFKNSKPDIIHSWNSMCSIYSLPAAKLLGVKFVNGFLRNAPQCIDFKNYEFIRSKLTFPLSDIIAANSHAGLRSYKVPSGKAVCLHNGFDFSRIEGLEDKDKIKKQFGINTRYVVGMVASFTDKKDYSTFIKAAEIVLEKRMDVTFVAVGDGPDMNRIKSIIKEEHRENIKLLGRQNRVLNIVNVFDIGCLITNVKNHGEGIPNVCMEYMSLKKPVIATDCGGNRELIQNNITGFIVRPEDPHHIAEDILFLLNNQNTALEVGLNGYHLLKKRFDLLVMGKRFEDIYVKLNQQEKK